MDTRPPLCPSHPGATPSPYSRPRAPETSSSVRAMSPAIQWRHCIALNVHVDFGRPFLGRFFCLGQPFRDPPRANPTFGLAGTPARQSQHPCGPTVRVWASPNEGAGINAIAPCSPGCKIVPVQGPEVQSVRCTHFFGPRNLSLQPAGRASSRSLYNPNIPYICSTTERRPSGARYTARRAPRHHLSSFHRSSRRSTKQ